MTLKILSNKQTKKSKILGVFTPFNFFFHIELPLLPKCRPLPNLPYFLYIIIIHIFPHEAPIMVPLYFLISEVIQCDILTNEDLKPQKHKNMKYLLALVCYLNT